MSLRNRLKFSLAPAALSLVFVSGAAAQYSRTDFATDSGTATNPPDKALVNSWGLVALPTTPFWLSDNGTGLSTLYTGGGTKLGLTVTIPSQNGTAQGTPTGIVGNSSSDFVITETVAGKKVSGASIFIFATLDGTISGWNPNVDGIVKGLSHATIAADRSGVGASYTGLAIGSHEGQNFLYAADGGPNRRVDVFDAGFHLKDFGDEAFVDRHIPADFAPYGIQTLTDDDGEQTVWVTYTSLSNAPGGFVAAFSTSGRLKRHLHIERGPLNSPWGIALAPKDFGPFSRALLISNNAPNGRINAFDPRDGRFLGPLRDQHHQPIVVDQIWAIQFGQDGGPNGAHNQLFFTGGPDNYGHGVFGVINFVGDGDHDRDDDPDGK
jgi:uncharacterized protein (TIGR03118 family)